MSVDGIFPAMPDDIYLKDKGKPACLIRALTPTALADWRDTLAGPHLAWMETAHFTAAAGEILLLPDSAGGLEAVLLGLGAMPDPMALAALPKKLPRGAYRLDAKAPDAVREMAPLAWALGAYQFKHYKKGQGYVGTLAYKSYVSCLLYHAIWLGSQIRRYYLNILLHNYRRAVYNKHRPHD